MLRPIAYTCTLRLPPSNVGYIDASFLDILWSEPNKSPTNFPKEFLNCITSFTDQVHRGINGDKAKDVSYMTGQNIDKVSFQT